MLSRFELPQVWWMMLLIFVSMQSCSAFRSKKVRNAQNIQREIRESKVFARAFSGFTLMDAQTGKTLASVNDQHLFTPASNAKILTLAACLEYLGDTLPGIKVAHTTDQQWIVRGTGDPTFLHPEYQAWQQPFQWLKDQQAPIILERQLVPRFGSGWAWDDYVHEYSAERSDFPIYGNVVTFEKRDDQWRSTPNISGLFPYEPGNELYPNTSGIYRLEHIPYYFLSLPDSAYATGFIDKVPFPEMTGEEGLLARFLPDTMGKRFAHFCFRNFPGSCETELDGPWQTIHSAPLDTVLRHMMHESNNLLAEQLLLICADQRFDQLKEELVIQDMLGNSLANVNPVPRWVDGSGLSRYNLISPGGLALVLRRMWQTQPQDKLFFYFPAPGGTGTLKDWPDNSSWVGKTGSMSGVMCLSGYLKSKTGKVLIFSFMHNNFAGSNRSLKVEMQRILQLIHDLY